MAGTNSERELIAEGPAIILVHPQLGDLTAVIEACQAADRDAELAGRTS